MKKAKRGRVFKPILKLDATPEESGTRYARSSAVAFIVFNIVFYALALSSAPLWSPSGVRVELHSHWAVGVDAYMVSISASLWVAWRVVRRRFLRKI